MVINKPLIMMWQYWLQCIPRREHYHSAHTTFKKTPMQKTFYWLQKIIKVEEHLRPPRGVCGACLHQVHKPCAIGAIPSQTYCDGIVPMAQGLWDWWGGASQTPRGGLKVCVSSMYWHWTPLACYKRWKYLETWTSKCTLFRVLPT